MKRLLLIPTLLLGILLAGCDSSGPDDSGPDDVQSNNTVNLTGTWRSSGLTLYRAASGDDGSSLGAGELELFIIEAGPDSFADWEYEGTLRLADHDMTINVDGFSDGSHYACAGGLDECQSFYVAIRGEPAFDLDFDAMFFDCGEADPDRLDCWYDSQNNLPDGAFVLQRVSYPNR